MKLYYSETALGKIAIAEQDGNIQHVYLSAEKVPENVELAETALLKEAFAQLKAYLNGDLKQFSLPLVSHGTSFMQKVWQAVSAVPYGYTESYKRIAEKIGQPTAARAVGMANHKNPLPIFIPCHRIIGSNGKLTGYAGGLAVKQFLLELEQRHGTF